MDIQDELVILDEQGRPRIILDAKNNSPFICLMDEQMNGKVHIGLSANGDMYFNCCADNGSPLVSFGVNIKLGMSGIFITTTQGAPNIDISVVEHWATPIIDAHNNCNHSVFSLGPHPFLQSPTKRNESTDAASSDD